MRTTTPVSATAVRTGRVLKWGVPAATGVLAAGLVLGLPALGMPSVADWFKSPSKSSAVLAQPPASAAAENGTLELPADVVQNMGVTTARVGKAAAPRPLQMAGSLSFDVNHLYRIQSRFGGEVIALGNVPEPGTRETGGQTRERPLRYGDRVQRGDRLAVVLCKDLGEKKSELVDGLVKLHVDQRALARYEDMAARGILPEATLLQQRATVASDRNAVVKAERTLITWQVDRKDIDAVKAEAQRIQDDQSLRDLARESRWAEVEVRAPAAGVVVEKNVAVGNIVDTTFDLYKIADLNYLGVLVHAYEEDLEDLRRLDLSSGPYPWQVRLAADPRRPPLKSSGLQRIGKVVDPSQHTAPVMGLVDNTAGDLQVGQFVTASVLLPAPDDVVSLPASALDEDGDSSIIFVQPDPSRTAYQRRRVVVTQRLGETIYVRSSLSEEQKARGLSQVRPGDLVVTRGVVELRSALGDGKHQQ
jgi:cobalt-zinc-cadmium efflux system membrane fusion protein